jgi:acyl carrier protein
MDLPDVREAVLMAPRTPTIDALRDLPPAERRDALEALVVTEVKAALLMTDEDELPLEASYFDLGLTSLTVSDLKQKLELMLGRELDGNLLFNSPTVRRVLDHLEEDVLTDLFPIRKAVASAPARNALVDELLDDLYRR